MNIYKIDLKFLPFLIFAFLTNLSFSQDNILDKPENLIIGSWISSDNVRMYFEGNNVLTMIVPKHKNLKQEVILNGTWKVERSYRLMKKMDISISAKSEKNPAPTFSRFLVEFQNNNKAVFTELKINEGYGYEKTGSQPFVMKRINN